MNIDKSIWLNIDIANINVFELAKAILPHVNMRLDVSI